MILMRCLPAIAAILALVAFAPTGQAQTPSAPLTAEQAEAVNRLVHDYLMNNPKVLQEAIDHAQEAARDEAEQKVKAEMISRREELESDPTSPVLGNSKGDVTIVEFFDYRCPYCKASAPAVAALLVADKRVRLVLKDFPILGKESTFASRIALAVQKHGKYAEYYKAMFALKSPIDDAATLEIVKSIGLDPEQIRKESDASDIDTMLAHNFDLAKAIGVEGTPAFVLGDTLIPGAVTVEVLKEQIAALRGKKS
jgi:protein-disulfide isomerase